MKSKHKKGDISVDFLITVVLLIAGFIILLVLFSNIGGTGKLDRTVCHTSVIYRASLPNLFQGYVPLKCQTNKICITSGLFSTGNCVSLKGETGITTVKVSSGTAGEKQIEQIYTQEMFDCWQTMGEGKVSLWNQYLAQNYGFGDVYPTCVVCTRIGFDYDKLKAAGINLDNVNIQEYMLTHVAPNSNLTYFEYMVGQGGQFSTSALDTSTITAGGKLPDASAISSATSQLSATSQQDLNNLESSKTLSQDYQVTPSSRLIDFNKDSTAILFMQITSPKQGETFGNLVTAAISILGFGTAYKPGAFFSFPQFSVAQDLAGATSPTGVVWEEYAAKSITATGKFAAKPLTYAIIATAVATAVIQQVNVAWQRSVTAGKCQDTEIGTNARNGCSVVRAIPYEPDTISTYCRVIESTP